MSKKVTIPTCMDPFIVIVNGVKYFYPAGQEVEVPDEVALVIERHNATHKKNPDGTLPPHGTGGGASSWNDLKDKPFGEKTVPVIAKQDVSFWFEGGQFSVSRMPQVGEKLTVTLNGKNYECVAWNPAGDSVIVIGSGSARGIANAGENVPFTIGFYNPDGVKVDAFVSTAVVGECAFSIVDGSGVTLLSETVVVEIEGGVCYTLEYPLDRALVSGNTYKVAYNGVTYMCVAWEGGGGTLLGDGRIDDYVHSEDVPFVIGSYSDDDGSRYWWAAVTSATLAANDTHAISVDAIEIETIEPKYLPGMMPVVFNAKDARYTEGNSAYYFVNKTLCDSISAGNIPMAMLVWENDDDSHFADIWQFTMISLNAIGTNNHILNFSKVDTTDYKKVYLFESEEAAFDHYDR